MDNNKPSATALLIARSQLLLSREGSLGWAVGPDRARLYQSFVDEYCGHAWTPGFWEKAYLDFIGRRVVPGMYLHHALRKLCIAGTVKELLDAGQCRQVVVIAAGYDPLAAMLHRQYKDVRFIELDHPATQNFKKKALEKQELLSENLALVSADLTRQPIAEVLRDGGFSPALETAFIAEGITMYLTEQQIEEFIAQIKNIGPKKIHLVFTYMNRQPSGSIQFESAAPPVDWWLKMKKEPFRWGIETAKMGAFLSRQGFSLRDIFDSSRLAAAYLEGRGLGSSPLARGENICVAES